VLASIVSAIDRVGDVERLVRRRRQRERRRLRREGARGQLGVPDDVPICGDHVQPPPGLEDALEHEVRPHVHVRVLARELVEDVVAHRVPAPQIDAHVAVGPRSGRERARLDRVRDREGVARER
jgi:hypothetical protein